MKKILAIGAHPDDIEYYAGGTLAQMAMQNSLALLIATDGKNGSHENVKANIHKIQRKLEQKKAAEIIGAQKVMFLDFPDGELENCIKGYKLELFKILIKLKPNIIFTFDPQMQFHIHPDFHPDHRSIALATLDVILIDATLPCKGGITNWKPYLYLFNCKDPNKTIDIHKTFQIKRKALNAFKSQSIVLKKHKSTQVERFRFYKTV